MRIADEVCLQMHLLNLSFVRAVTARCESEDQAREICRKQLVGIAAERLHRLLDLPCDRAAALRVLALHPLLNAAAYVAATVDHEAVHLHVRPGDAHPDGSWISLVGAGDTTALQAAVRAVDDRFDVELVGTDEDWTAVLVESEPAKEADEVAVTRFSTGSSFTFQPRGSLPITPV